MNIIQMKFPNKNNYLDGKTHMIEPISLHKVNIPNKEIYVLIYNDLTHSYNDCITVISRKNGIFYKNPLNNYGDINILLDNSQDADISILNSRIELGNDEKIENIIDLINNQPQIIKMIIMNYHH